MFVRLIHENGQEYTLPASQVVVLDDHGQPISAAMVEQGLIVHSDASRSEWPEFCRNNRLQATPVQQVK